MRCNTRTAAGALLILCYACTEPVPSLGSPVVDDVQVTVRLVDEDGLPVVGQLVGLGTTFPSDSAGSVALSGIREGASFRVEADGFLDEPLAVGRAQSDVTLTLYREAGRISLHLGGDFMMGRRYETGVLEDGTGALLQPGTRRRDSAQVVASLAPLFSAADARVINLETVVTTRSLAEAYPRKRFLLSSHPDTLAALEALAVDAVVLSNNHTRDWLDVGVGDTLTALANAGLPQVGGGRDQAAAAAPLALERHGQRIEMLAFTTVDGDFVNDSYPLSAAEEPPDLNPAEAWQYEERLFGFVGNGLAIETEQRTVGAAWQLYRAQTGLSDSADAALWGALESAYPELQDWAARRGHGGANPWTRDAETDIASARGRADLVIVQLHAGFQFQTSPSGNVRRIAYDAIDAGADLVIAHHPHVLQGFEWYKGRLIAFSLGNFTFDQNFLATYPSAFLRVIWGSTGLVAARVVPFELNGYRPVPLTGHAATRVLRQMHEASLFGGESFRGSNGLVRVRASIPDASVIPTVLEQDGNAALLRESAGAQRTTVTVPAGTTAALDAGFWRVPEPASGGATGENLRLGRDLFGWGHFEESLLDESDSVLGHVSLTGEDRVVVASSDAPEGERFLRMRRAVTNASDLLVRPVSRIPLTASRIVDSAENPLDGQPAYSVRLWARWNGRGQSQARVRIDYYHFDDSNPAVDPLSELLAQEQIALEVPRDGAWHPLDLPITIPVTAKPINQALPYIIVSPSDRFEAILDVDQLELVEWRALQPSLAGAFDYLENAGATDNNVAMDFVPISASPDR